MGPGESPARQKKESRRLLRAGGSRSHPCLLRELAFAGSGKIFRAGFKYRKAGVTLNNLELADLVAKRLWEDECYERHRRLMVVVDRINQRFGKDPRKCP